MIKGCQSFAGMVNFVSLFCPDLQKLLKPIYNLTRKGRQFLWEKEQQQDFDEIKHRLQRPPGLHLPNYILILANLLLVVHYIKFRMDNQDL